MVCDLRNIMEKRIVFFNGTLMQGGAERVISILSRRMCEQHYQVEILLYRDSEIFYDIAPQVQIVFVERETNSRNLFRNILWIRQYFKRNADVIISFLAPFNILSLVAHLGLKSKIVVADRNDPKYIPAQLLIRKLRNILYCVADGIVLQTTQNQNYFSKIVRKKSIVIKNPIDLADKAGLALRTAKKHRIVSIGRLMPQKNQEMLIEAFSMLTDEFPDYTLTIYGEGPNRIQLEEKIHTLKLESRVYLPGSVKNVYEKIADSELFVLTSNYEGMPNALIEAMCLGLPSISTRVSGADDLIEDGTNGELVDVGDAHGLANIMCKLLRNERLRRQYAEMAVRLNEQLEIDKIIQEWMGFISYLIKVR